MWKDSNELFNYALRELQVAVENNNPNVEIVLLEHFFGDKEEITEIIERLKLEETTKKLRERFNDYNLRSIVGKEGSFNAILTFKYEPCVMFYPLKWRLILQKKEVL